MGFLGTTDKSETRHKVKTKFFEMVKEEKKALSISAQFDPIK